jgi:S-formylglutathione hydrolase FrmB
MRFYYNASAHTLNFVGGPQWTIDQNHQYTIQITDGNAVAGVFLGGGGPLKIKTFFQNQLITPITVAPKSPTADDQLTVDILARVLVNGAWAVHFMTETFDFSALYGASPPDNQ